MKKLLVIVGMMLASKLTVQACRCMPPPPADKALAEAVAVFVGTVQEVKREEQSRDKIVTLTVEQAWKGIAADQKTVTVSTCASGACCGYGVATHAKQCHKMESIPQEMVYRVKSSIKTVTVTV